MCYLLCYILYFLSLYAVRLSLYAVVLLSYVVLMSLYEVIFSIIPTFCHSISSVLSFYRVVYALYGVQTILPRVHFALLFAVLSSSYYSYYVCRYMLWCGAYVIICSDFSIIPTFCHSISSVLSLYRVV